MNTQNNELDARKVSKLEQLSAEQKAWLVEFSARCSLVNLVDALKEQGVETSDSALSRFLRKHRAEALVEDAKELAGTAEALAERGKGGKLREGTLEAVRQRLYEQTLVLKSPEEARELYAALVKEEVKLRELELEGRKVAAMEQQVKLQGVKIQVLAEKGRDGRGRVKAEVTSSEPVANISAGDGETERGQARIEAPAGVDATTGRGGASGMAGDLQEALRVLRDVNEIVNRGGSCEEKVLDIRGRLAEAAKLLDAGEGGVRTRA
jgi:hypothetical protein